MISQTIIQKAKSCIDSKVADLTIYGAVSDEPVPFEDRENLDYKKYKTGESWGRLFSCGWFHLTGSIDPGMPDEIYLKLDMNCEALLVDNEGTPVKGFTSGSSAYGLLGSPRFPAKKYFPLRDLKSGDGAVDLWIEAGMNDLFGNVRKKGRIKTVEIVKRDLDARRLYYDLGCLDSLMKAAWKRDRQAFKIYRSGLNRIAGLSVSDKNNWIERSLSVTETLFNTRTKAKHLISALGHAHTDLAWLWPMRETKRKAARTFSTALRLMEEYDDYVFGASQPQLYKWMKDEQPELYAQIRQRVAEGRWEVQGGMWVEADTNISGEEALVRQMLYGIRFFKEEFDVSVKSLWLPDVFGYSGNLPQIIRKSGLDYFMTIKIAWNDTNKFPYHSFNWIGIDGTTVFAHMPPEGDYNSPVTVKRLLESMEKYREKKLSNETLCLFGVGDGGGGPSAAHIERIRRLGGTAPVSDVKMESSTAFFNKIAEKKDKFPRFSGELYLEKHRGTYTSQGRVKLFNRKMEQKLKTLETLLVQTRSYDSYKDEIREIWKEVLLYQFHDILPGSSIKRVYDECLARYEILYARLDAVFSSITGAEIINGNEDCDVNDIKAYNPLAVEALAERVTGKQFQQLRIAPMSNRIIEAKSWSRTRGNTTSVLENELLRVRLNRDGSINSVFDKVRRMETLGRAGNRFRVYTDIANAWDIFRHYRLLPSAKMRLVKSETWTYGPVQEVVQHYKLGRNELVQKIRLKPDSRLIEFVVTAEWKSVHSMLRTSFPLKLKTDKAVFDIQFGSIERSTKNNTKILRAQYEACGQNWVDMNNGDWGAALITDCKYGFRAKNSTLDLNLIKSTDYPAKKGDIGTHHFKYCLYVHEGNHAEAEVDAHAMNFNSWIPVTTKGIDINDALFTISNRNITYSSVKKSEDGDAVIIRLYERSGSMQNCTLCMNLVDVQIYEVNMAEENPVLIAACEQVELQFSPFEVKTLMIV